MLPALREGPGAKTNNSTPTETKVDESRAGRVQVEPRQAVVVLREDRSQQASFRYTIEEHAVRTHTPQCSLTETEVLVLFALDTHALSSPQQSGATIYGLLYTFDKVE